MAAIITTSSSVLPKNNINGVISTSSFATCSVGTKVQQVTLTSLQEAINKLTTYANNISNCGNCNAYTINSTSCQSTSCQSTGCQSQSCQSQCKAYSQYHSDTGM